MPEQITYYHDVLQISPFCHRVEIALLEAGASYTAHGFDIHNKPAWFTQANPLTGKIPVITYGGPNVPPEEPSPLSFKVTESLVILEFIADLFPNSGLLLHASDPTARARVRFFIDVAVRNIEAPFIDLIHGVSGSHDKLIEGLEKVQSLLPDPDAIGQGEYAFGKDFTNADCAIAPLLACAKIVANVGSKNAEPGVAERLKESLAGAKFDRLRRYQKALWERESIKKVVDIKRLEGAWKKAMRAQN